MRVCYIHIGPHKTGSSSIQQFLRINQEKLFERGLHHPIVESRIERNSRAHDFVLKGGLDERGDILPGATLWQDLDQVVAAGSHDVVLSAEMFSLLFRKPRSLAPIHAYFTRRGYAIEIIAYFRDAPAWVNSWYVQAQKRLFGARSLGEFVDVVINRLDPAHALAPYRQDAGFRISPVPFESAVAEGLEVDFVRRCGVTEVDDLVLKPLRNPNAGRKTVYVAQRIMKTHAGNLKHHPNYENVYRSFKRIWRKHGWRSLYRPRRRSLRADQKPPGGQQRTILAAIFRTSLARRLPAEILPAFGVQPIGSRRRRAPIGRPRDTPPEPRA